MPLLKSRRDPFWAPYVYLVYLAFLFFQPAVAHADWLTWTVTAAAAAAGATFYLLAWRLGRRRVSWISLAGLLVLGYGFSPSNNGASSFLIYAAALSGFVLSPRAS